MKKIISFLIVCMLLCGNVFAENNYTIINMSEFANVDNFAEGLCAVQDSVTGRWGFVDVNKNWVISPQFKSASYFKNGLCAVNTVDGESVLIDHNGNTVFKRSNYLASVKSDNFFLDKHGTYLIIFEDMNKAYSTGYWITLVDKNYQAITTDGVSLSTFSVTQQSPDVSKTLFWENNQGRVYNYKGIDISNKLTDEKIALSTEMLVNNKYIIGQTDEKTKCFDIDGNKLAEFDNDKYYIHGDMLVSDSKVYNIPENKMIFDSNGTQVEVKTYYDKYFTVKKQNGTSALYSAAGEILVNFGKWDYIYPSSISNRMVVSAGKCGVADYDGNLLFPLEYSNYNISEPMYYDGRYAFLRKGDIYVYVYIDMVSLNCFEGASGMKFGYKYHCFGKNVLNKELKYVYTAGENEYLSYLERLNDGVVKISRKGGPFGILLFNDSGVKVELDSSRLEFDVLPIIQNGRTLVPMRAIFEALGANVEWNGETQTIIAKNKDITIQMQIRNNTLIKNGKSTQMDVSPQLVDGRTMVPVRAVSDSFNVIVDWNGYTQTVSLFTN